MGKVIILSGPGGTGKNTILELLLDRNPRLHKLVTATDRAPRQGEEEGFDHYFLSTEAFQEKLKAGEFAESNILNGHYYGILKNSLVDNKDMIMEVTVKRAVEMDRINPNTVTIFIAPPSTKDLEVRMRERGDTEQHIQARLKLAEAEMAMQSQFDHIVVNPTGRPEVAASEIEKIIQNA